MSTITDEDDFYYTVSDSGFIEAYKRPEGASDEELEGGNREIFVSSKAATALALQRARAALTTTTSMVAGDRIRKYLGRLEENAEDVLRLAHEDALKRK